jgi:hypothetical protein
MVAQRRRALRIIEGSPPQSLREIDVRGLVGYETTTINYAVLFYSIQRFLAVWKEIAVRR